MRELSRLGHRLLLTETFIPALLMCIVTLQCFFVLRPVPSSLLGSDNLGA